MTLSKHCSLLHIAPSETSKLAASLRETSHQMTAAPVAYRMEGCKVSSPASAQVSSLDLRCFDMKKEKEENASPRGVLEGCIADLGTEEGSSQIQEPEIRSSKLEVLFRWRGFFKMWKRGSIKRLSSFPPLVVPKISRRKSRSAREKVDVGFCYFKSPWKNFTLSELQRATKNFSQENLIGKGGYAEVYRGCLPDGQLVAIKVLKKGALEDQIIGFLSEIGTIAHVNHPNTAKLIGFGVEGGTYLVLQLSPLGSLGSLLRGSREKLQWAIRYKIILGTAAGLLYLHENCQRRIIHRDIKADNILLTEDFEPRICDFGLAKWLPKEWSHHHVQKFEGTFGYFAPEYFMHGIVDEKTDVFSFGVLLLELITGRGALEGSQKSLVLWAKPLLDNNNVKQLVDHSLGENYNPEEMDRVILTASLCIEQSPILRPWMSQVVMLLRGENHKLCSREHQKGILQRAFSEDLLGAEEYNLTKHLSDLSRHKAVALGS